MQFINTLELFGVNLLKHDPIGAALEDVDLLWNRFVTSDKLAFPHKCQLGVLGAFSGFVVLRVLEDEIGNPQFVVLFKGESIGTPLLLQIVVLDPVVVPFQGQAELENVHVVHLLNLQHINNAHGHVDDGRYV